jgi:UDP-glucose 4-epimerase
MLLVTGGAGYIGSHTLVQLIQAGYEIVVLDNLSNGSLLALERVKQITQKDISFVQGDIRDQHILIKIFKDYSINAVIHFAALKAVGESMHNCLKYFDNNISGTIELIKAMENAQVYQLVFSSSATIYGETEQWELSESMPLGMPTNNYGYTKLVVEQLLQKISQSNRKWSIANLRYFNPIGAHQSGLIGEDPKGIPNNLLPFVSQVAIGKLDYLRIFGKDYPTPDGTAIRDYIHVVDLAEAHLKALQYIEKNSGNFVWNIGTGTGYSVRQIVDTFEQVTGKQIPFKEMPRRQGDIAACWANVHKVAKELGWKATYSLQDMISDLWRWQVKNPNGYSNDSSLSY